MTEDRENRLLFLRLKANSGSEDVSESDALFFAGVADELELLRQSEKSMCEALELVLLFHSDGWTDVGFKRWEKIAGTSEVTSIVLCNYIDTILGREVLEK